jgi:hypothetical protein
MPCPVGWIWVAPSPHPGASTTMPDNDEAIARETLNVAEAATQLLTMTEALALQHGPEAARDGLLVAYAVLGERTVGRDALLAELNHMIATLTEHSTIEGVISKWLH